jgi:putative FmdB family regulatory protein
MPIYEYACTACDHRADILHGINDPGPNFCPSCGRERTMKKVFAPPTIHFKGSGWAKKDRSVTAKSKKADAKDGEGGDKGGTEKTEKADKSAPDKAGTSKTEGGSKAGSSTGSSSSSD